MLANRVANLTVKGTRSRQRGGLVSGSALAKKLRLLAGMTALVLNAPPGYRELLGDLPVGVTLHTEPGGQSDFVHLFVHNRAELERQWPVALAALRRDGVLWLSYPKRSSKTETDLTRDEGWAVVSQAGLRPVTQVAIDDVWSALRFRPIELVKARP